MQAWGVKQRCVLCRERDETRDHLFFACPYTLSVWIKLAGRLGGYGITPDWNDTLEFISHNSHHAMDRLPLKMVFQSCLYHMWKEHNMRRHQAGLHTVEQAIPFIDKSVRNRITSLKYKAGHKYMKV